jgi:putative transposase
MGYRGTFKKMLEEYGFKCDISEKIKPKEWRVLPKRWVVERTFAWLNNSRRLSKDYEIKTFYEETMVKIAFIHTVLKRY